MPRYKFPKGNPGGPGRPKGSKQGFIKRFNASLTPELFQEWMDGLRKAMNKGEGWAFQLLASKIMGDKHELDARIYAADHDEIWLAVQAEFQAEIEAASFAVGNGIQLPQASATGRDALPSSADGPDLEPALRGMADRPRQE